MSFSIDSIEFWVLCSAVICCLGLLLYVAHIQLRAHRQKRAVAAVSGAIIEYFHRTGVAVTASCTSLDGGDRFTALVESEPMKRFRLSHIIEITLRDHIQKTFGLQLEKIYWRFPIKAPRPTSSENKPATEQVATDEYINEGLVPYKDLPKVVVTELSWDKFEEVSTTIQTDKSTGDESEKSAKAEAPQQPG